MRCSRAENSLRRLFLYADGSEPGLDVDDVKRYVEELAPGLEVAVRGDFVQHHDGNERMDELAWAIAQARVTDSTRPLEDFGPLPGEVEFEKRMLSEPGKIKPGILYDGFRLSELLFPFIPPGERDAGTAHIILTGRLVGTFDREDRRYHARAIICHVPSLISTSGVVLAPARPREYYIDRQRAGGLGGLSRGNDEEKTYLALHDERLTDVLKGYVLQTVFFYLGHQPFCDDPDCRLFNAHRQVELIRAQLESGRLCERHTDILADAFGE